MHPPPPCVTFLYWYKIVNVPAQYPFQGSTAKEIAESIERAVTSGELPPDALLPPVRNLAAQLGVAPNTAAAAYRALRDRGIVTTDGRRGTRVRPRPSVAPRAEPGSVVSPDARDLADGNPAADLLPDLRAALTATARAHQRAKRYGVPVVSAGLAERGRESLAAEGVPAGDLTVASGTLDAIERVLQAHLRPGDAVAVEDPGYANLLDLVAALGLRALPVPIDEAGPLPDALRTAVRRGARALVVTPRAQNPTGAAVSAERSVELRALLRTAGLLLIEDDHAAGIAGAPLHSLAGSCEHWAYARSLSKAYGPDLRIALVAGDPTTVSRVEGRLRLGHGWVSHLLQDTAAALLADPAAAAAVARAEQAYAKRRAALVAALRERGVSAYGRSGLNVWVPVRDETATVTALLAAGWAVSPGARFRLASPPGIRITVSELAPDEIGPLADAVRDALRAPTRTGA